ncbi:hypothetical protein SLEP1_g17080 [Rubroshorea leprosula]|uniref:Uncharacterized protein n=1 Tax=Rubroshorea leprosula TaxID=152421 RepID=A0AAV5J262_9ROSI|nr:hypothetical protein SLEP1_g17080 [Rubroshorea leprosula]
MSPTFASSSQRERGLSSTFRPHIEQRVGTLPLDSLRRARDNSDAKDDVPLIRRRTSFGAQPVQPAMINLSNVPSTSAHDATEPLVASTSITAPQMHTLRALAIQNWIVRPRCYKAFSYAVALFKCEQTRELIDNYKRLTFEKASFEDEVNRLQSYEMTNKVASAESRADELAHKDRTKNAEVDRDKVLSKLSSLKQRVAEANRNLVQWLVDSEMFQDAMAVALANTTIEIYNDIRGKVLHHRPDFSIGKLAFYEGDEINEQGKSLAPFIDTTVRLRWELNEEGVPVWPSSIVEEGEDLEGLPSFDAWLAEPIKEEAEPSSTPPTSQPITAPVLPPPARSTPAHACPTCANAFVPVDLMDD